MTAAESPAGGTHPGTPAHPGQAVYDALRRSEQPPALRDDIDRVDNAAHLARTVLPGPVGDYLYRDLIAWCEFGWRFDTRGEALAIAADLEKRAHAIAIGRTYG